MNNNWPLIRETLPGGLRAVLLPRPARQAVTFMVMIGVGSRYETEKQWGLSHFLEHMFFKGTETRPKTEQIAAAIEGVGGSFNAFTSEEVTAYHVTVAKEHLGIAADVVSDILLRPLFDQAEIDRERGVITEEIRMYTNMPQAHVRHIWAEALWGEHPLGRRIDGIEESVAKFNREDFIDYVGAHYHTENAVVAVAGNFDEQKMLVDLKTIFKDLPVGEETVPASVPRDLPAVSFKNQQKDELEQTHLVIGAPGVGLADERRWAAELLAAILGGGMSSRLFLSVREREGLAYTVRTRSDEYSDAGDFATYAGVRTDKALRACELILAEYDKAMNEKVSVKELDKVKKMVYGHMMLDLEETHTMAVSAAADEILTKEILIPSQVKEKLESVTAEDVQKVAQDLLAPKRRAMALLGPQAKVGDFEKLVVG